VYCRSGRLVLAATLGLLASCARNPSKAPLERIAVLRFENLGADALQDWMGRAFPEIITAELAGSPSVYAIPSGRLHNLNLVLGPRPISSPGISVERSLAVLSGAQRVAYGYYAVRGGRVEATLTVEDLATRQMPVVVSFTAGDVVSAATGLAGRIAKQTTAYGAHDVRAIRSYCLAIESPDGASAVKNLEDAIAADPDFAKPYSVLAQIRSQRQDRPGALSLLEAALGRSGIAGLDRARIEADIALLRNDLPARRRALAANLKLDPGDPMAWRALAEANLVLGDYKGAVDAFRESLAIEPDEVNAWNRMAYAAAYAGDLPGAMAALRRYQSIRPADPNPLDSMGDVNLVTGHLREAEDFFLQTAKKDPNFQNGSSLFKAAFTRLMTGDIAGADAIARQFADARQAARDPLVDYYKAEWAWISGRRKAAAAQLEDWARASETGPLREVASRAYGEAAIWRVLLGDREGAAALVQRSISVAGATPASVAISARYLVQPPAPASEWNSRLNQMLPNVPPSSGKDLLLAYALLVSKDFSAAAALLKGLDSGGAAFSEPVIPIAQAWTLIETGRVADAAPLIARNPIVQGGGPFLSFLFPRLFFLRAEAAKAQGNTEEARRNYELFLKLSGPDALLWGEEARAAAAGLQGSK
jgi:tetratricopeptide (TPR) repeat protein